MSRAKNGPAKGAGKKDKVGGHPDHSSDSSLPIGRPSGPNSNAI